MQNKKIAVFGGSFNPPLISHFNLAKDILKNYNDIEKIIFIPVSTKYDKRGLIKDEDRYNMLQLMCKGNSKIEVSEIEIKAERQLYTIETLNLIKKEYQKYDIYFILGTDNLKELNKWHNPEMILKDFKLLVLERKTDNFEEIIKNDIFLSKNINSIIKAENITKVALSSTFVREEIKQGKDVSEFISREVFEYIKEHDLYK